MLKVEQGNAGLWYVTSDVVPGLLVTGNTQERALANVGQALADMQAAMEGAPQFHAPAPQVLDREALATLVYEAIRFSDWAAGQSISPAASQPALDPVDFINAYGEATGVWHDEKLAEHVRGLIAAPVQQSAASTVEPATRAAAIEECAAYIDDVASFYPADGGSKSLLVTMAKEVRSLITVPAAPTTSPEPDAVREALAFYADAENYKLAYQGYDPLTGIVRKPAKVTEDGGDIARAALCRPAHGGWEDFSTAPKDGTYILAIVAPNRGRHLEHNAGRMFVIRHAGKTDSGFDLGWSVYPGFGGASDADFTCWQPVSAPTIARHDRAGGAT